MRMVNFPLVGIEIAGTNRRFWLIPRSLLHKNFTCFSRSTDVALTSFNPNGIPQGYIMGWTAEMGVI